MKMDKTKIKLIALIYRLPLFIIEKEHYPGICCIMCIPLPRIYSFILEMFHFPYWVLIIMIFLGFNYYYI